MAGGFGEKLAKALVVRGRRSQEQLLPGDQAQGSGEMEKPGLLLFLSGPLAANRSQLSEHKQRRCDRHRSQLPLKFPASFFLSDSRQMKLSWPWPVPGSISPLNHRKSGLRVSSGLFLIDKLLPWYNWVSAS